MKPEAKKGQRAKTLFLKSPMRNVELEDIAFHYRMSDDTNHLLQNPILKKSLERINKKWLEEIG